jgi:hypothetical protein
MQQIASNLSVLMEAPIFNLGLLIDGVLKPSARQIRNRCMSKACPVAWASLMGPTMSSLLGERHIPGSASVDGHSSFPPCLRDCDWAGAAHLL